MPHRPLVSGLLACSQMVALAVVMHTPKEAAAWSFNLQSASRRVFMYVGTATYTYNAQGNATGVNNNPIVDTMQVTVQENLGLLGSHYRQLFTSVPRTRYTSQWNRASACPLGYSNPNGRATTPPVRRGGASTGYTRSVLVCLCDATQARAGPLFSIGAGRTRGAWAAFAGSRATLVSSQWRNSSRSIRTGTLSGAGAWPAVSR